MSTVMSSRTFPAQMPDLEGVRVLVVGLGKSGLAAARLAASHGARVLVTDRRSERELGAVVARARDVGATVHAGGHPPALAAEADLIVISPGVPPTIELLEHARRFDLPIWGEVELAAHFCRGRVVGVTGSNGKSTVTALAGHVLRGAGVPGGTGGNLETPFADLLALDGPDAVHAVELSSFQLETVETLRPEVAIVLNLSPDHLDRYPSLEAYGRAKARLLEVQRPEGFALLNADDEPSRVFREHVRGRLHLFSTREPVEHGAYMRDGRLVLITEHGEDDPIDAAELPLAGEHNLSNALAAALACRLVGVEPDAIAEGLRSFAPLPHRLQHVRSVGGVTFYNDSKATNPASTACALSSFGHGRVHLILGGRDKGADWTELEEPLRCHARQVLLVGEAAPALKRRFEGAVPMTDCDTVGRAVEAAFEAAETGDVVLLAPGCASFDQYESFEQRGEDFVRRVGALAERRGADG